jgi:hypothetical protein
MQQVREILEGYCDPMERKYAVKTIGQNGLTVRIRSLCYFDGAIRSMLRERFYDFARSEFESFWPTLQLLRQCWATEFIRITDKPRSRVKGVEKENLTIALCHERFRAEPTISVDLKQTEDKLFWAIDNEHKAHGVWEFRCEEWFHLDLNTALQSPKIRGGDIHRMTELILAWYRFVGGVVIGGGDLAFVTRAGLIGKRYAKELRRMMFAQRREWLRLADKRESSRR